VVLTSKLKTMNKVQTDSLKHCNSVTHRHQVTLILV